MARSNEQTKQKPQLLKSSSFSWDKAFFTSEGVLDADELSSIIEGDGNNVQHHLQPIQEIANLEDKMLQELEASTKNSNTIKTQSSPSNNVKSSATVTRNSTRSKTVKSKADSPSKVHLPSHLGISNLSLRTSSRTSSPGSPISPGSPRSPSSPSSIIQRSPRGSSSTSVPRRSSSTNARTKDEQKPGKSSLITLKNKSSPVNHPHPSSPLGISNSSSTTSLTSSPSSSSSLSSTYKVKPRSISTGRRATTTATSVHNRSLNRDFSATSSLKTRPTKSGSPNGVKERKIQATKTVETGFKPNAQRSSSPRPSRVQTGGSLKGVRNIYVVSAEVLDMKGKLNALKMELSMQKKDKCKETKMVPVKISKSESSSSIFKNTSNKRNNQARRT